ncbi:hypothetical protein [uncultured Neptuniibacter sp.]|uniref:hypothetical protein n=1 Tax=uncultured Neptuniibacter sp. TaxID=502143 RepID=UPI002637BDD6|nr:hypothetical protein [uncultured Neptuniibacter sp.]
MRSCSNLQRAKQLALSISDKGLFHDAGNSSTWFGQTSDGEQVMIWANNATISAGCLTLDLAEELNRAIDYAEEHSTKRLVLCLDSAGVDLNNGWQVMQQTAALIKRLLQLQINTQTTTIAVLGDSVGCYGGALLTASSCEYVLAADNTQCGVSGAKVIATLNNIPTEDHYPYYAATYRWVNKELFCILPKQIEEQRNLLLSLPYKTLDTTSIKLEIAQLIQHTAEDEASIAIPVNQKLEADSPSLGFPESSFVGCDELLEFILRLERYLDSEVTVPIIDGNCDQAFSFLNEQRGFSRYLSCCMRLMRLLSAQGKTLQVKVSAGGSGATFIALSLMADELSLGENCKIYPLPADAVSLFFPDHSLTGAEWKHHQ